MTPIESALFKTIPPDEFAALCRSCFSGQSGALLLRALCAVAHPLYPPVGVDALSTYRQIGRNEITALLTRYAGGAVTADSLPEPQPPNT